MATNSHTIQQLHGHWTTYFMDAPLLHTYSHPPTLWSRLPLWMFATYIAPASLWSADVLYRYPYWQLHPSTKSAVWRLPLWMLLHPAPYPQQSTQSMVCWCTKWIAQLTPIHLLVRGLSSSEVLMDAPYLPRSTMVLYEQPHLHHVPPATLLSMGMNILYEQPLLTLNYIN